MDIWLICSLGVGCLVLLLVFIIVFSAKQKFAQVQAILKPIETQSNMRVCDVWAIENSNNEKFSEINLLESGSYAYYPSSKIVSIEKDCTYSNSLFDVTAVAHEMGHAKAHLAGSAKFGLWYGLTLFEKGVCWAILPLFLIGFVLSFFSDTIGNIGKFSMNLSTAFTVMILICRVITIPTEKEASKIGIKILQETNGLTKNELEMSKKMLQVALSTYIFAFYQRLFANFILAKKIFVKVFKIKPKVKTSKKQTKETKEILSLIHTIEQDNKLNDLPIQTQNIQVENETNIIKRPPLDDEKGD